MWQTSLLPDACERVYEPPPPEPIWQWAESNVWLENKEAAEPGFYRSSKTPWTRRLQDLIKDPRMFVVDEQRGEWVVWPVHQINIKKSSQSGFSEACLNGLRWKARYKPENTIYAIDTQKAAKDISARLLPSLLKLDGNIFTEDADDLGSLVMRLRSMDIWFNGSFSSGEAANKQAPFVISDEREEHAEVKGDTSTSKNLDSRTKTAPSGLSITLSKPKKTTGPICKAFDRGNQEEDAFRCPHCRDAQWITMFSEEIEVPFSDELIEVEIDGLKALLPKPLPSGETRKKKTGRLVYEHCKNALGKWDDLRIHNETYFECGNCQGKIEEWQKAGLAETATWIPMAHGTPGVVSQHCNDFLSMDGGSTWGKIVLEFIDANEEGRTELQGFYNHRLGLGFADRANRTFAADIKANIATGSNGCAPYIRGMLPFEPRALVLGGDIGGNYAKWALGALHPNLADIAIIDWGEELHPRQIAEIIRTMTWEHGGKAYKIWRGFLDAKYRKEDTYKACLTLPKHHLIPTAGIGGGAARMKGLYSFHKIAEFPRLSQLTYNDREAKDEMYITCIKERKRRIWFPSDVVDESNKQFVKELCAESLKPDANGVMKWDEHPPANHWGDCVKDVVTGTRWLTRKTKTSSTADEHSDHGEEVAADV